VVCSVVLSVVLAVEAGTVVVAGRVVRARVVPGPSVLAGAAGELSGRVTS